MKFSLLLITLFFVSPLHALVWESDVEKALQRAESEKKPLLLFFTGSDWSGWSMKMKKELLSTEAFDKKVEGKFLCVEIDFPQHTPLSLECAEKNKRMKERFSITQYPRLLVVTSDGREIGRFGFTEEGAETFGERLITLMERDRNVEEALLKEKEGSSCPEHLANLYRLALEFGRKEEAQALLMKGVAIGDSFFLLERYRLLVEEGQGKEKEALRLREKIAASDPDNAKGSMLTLALLDYRMQSQMENHDADTTIAPLADYLERYGKNDPNNRWRLEMMIAQVYLNFDKISQALSHAEKSYLHAPAVQKAEIARSLASIRSSMASEIASRK